MKWRFLGITAVVVVALTWLLLVGSRIYGAADLIASSEGQFSSVEVDFAALWGAARLAVEGRPEAVFDVEALQAVQSMGGPVIDGARPWLYPPLGLLVLAPLGLLPFIAASTVFIALSVVTLLFALRCALPEDRHTPALVAFSPVTAFAAAEGQVSMLLVSAALFGFAMIASGRPARGLVSCVPFGQAAARPPAAARACCPADTLGRALGCRRDGAPLRCLNPVVRSRLLESLAAQA